MNSNRILCLFERYPQVLPFVLEYLYLLILRRLTYFVLFFVFFTESFL